VDALQTAVAVVLQVVAVGTTTKILLVYLGMSRYYSFLFWGKIMPENTKIVSHHLPLACSLPAEEQPARGEDISILLAASQQMQELADGYAFQYPGERVWVEKLTNLIMEERSCCQFFTFALIFEPAQGPIWLHIRGQEEVKEMIKDQFLPHN